MNLMGAILLLINMMGSFETNAVLLFASRGSTEWVEENKEILASRAVAYLNVDCAVGGPGFHVLATPQLDELIIKATQQVTDLDNSSQSIYESWTGSGSSPLIGRLGGGGSDYAAFVQHMGIPAADIAFGGAASVWELIALWLADEEFLPFDYLSYAKELEEIEASKGWTTWKKDHLKVREINDRLMMAERAFTDRDGLFGMSWYKHLIYGPSKHNDYGSQSFPGIDDAVKLAKTLHNAESWHRVQHEVWRDSRVIRQASLVLFGQLT
ncbi:hypothetical protein RIF29_39334 [Crotalaria pallida]|uniref:Transferrin receptor-like dimerisation domain-containing protein n=1 Tax=Crotalaria pallida TaxID=3830 RepID=A0AAN9E2P8_CROPI